MSECTPLLSSLSKTQTVLPHALKLPILKSLATPHEKGSKQERQKRVVLASASPRRQELLEMSGLRPEIIPSTFAENLPHSTYAHSLAEYPIATAYEKAMEVYERLLSSEGVDGENPPDLVISADTVIVFPPQLTPGTSENPESTAREVLGSGSSRGGRSNGTSSFGAAPSKVLEKPMDKHDQMKMLSDLNGKTCEVVTGVTIVYPTIAQPGFRMQSISISTLVHFNDNSPEVLKAYVENGEGLDRAGGFAVQGLGGILIDSIEGDFQNVVGFPLWPFWRWMSDLYEDGCFQD